MRKITILTFILSLIFVPVILDSCHSNSECECCDQPTGDRPYHINDVYLTVTANGHTAPYRVSPKILRFGFELDPKYLSYSPKRYGTMGAYADCAPQTAVSAEKFTSVKITSDNDLITSSNNTFAKGTDITEQFLLTGFVKNDSIKGLNFSFAPAFFVSTEQQHNFTFEFALDDGRKFDLQSGHFSLIIEE